MFGRLRVLGTSSLSQFRLLSKNQQWMILSLVLLLPSVYAESLVNPKGYHLWTFFTIPPIGGFVGWLTNVLALKMTFYPVEFFGLPLILIDNEPLGLIGWQGIIPSKAGKMAGIAVDLMVGKLIDMEKVFGRLDPNKMAEVMAPAMKKTMKKVIDCAGHANLPEVWETLPLNVKEDIYESALKTTPEFFENFLLDIQSDIFSIFDVRDFAVRKMTIDKSLTNEIFLTCGAKEFKFIEHGGFIFGFLFGCLQALVFVFYQESWVLPVAGFVVGYLTNFIALKMIFEPIEPVKYGPFTLQGLFLKRQQEVAVIFAKMCAERIFTADKMWEEILYGPKADNFDYVVRKHARISIEKMMSNMEGTLSTYLTPQELRNIIDRISDVIILDIPNSIHLGYDYSQKTLAIEDEIREKLKALPPAEFEGVLHPVFQEDEFKLILVGAILGLAVGFFQLFVMFDDPPGSS